MRVRSLVTIALLLPGALSAQRRMGGRVGGRAAPPTSLPPTAPVVAREMSYVPRNYSVESYMFYNYVLQPSAATNLMMTSGALNNATAIDYRLGSHFSLVGEMTTPMFGGGTVSALTFEFGTRFRPWGATVEAKAHPYLDARVGHIMSNESWWTADPTAVNPTPRLQSRFGRGTGAIAGGGSDFALTRSLSLTTGLWGMRSNLHAASIILGLPKPGTFKDFWQTSYRFALGVRWNPMRAVPKYDDPQ